MLTDSDTYCWRPTYSVSLAKKDSPPSLNLQIAYPRAATFNPIRFGDYTMGWGSGGKEEREREIEGRKKYLFRSGTSLDFLTSSRDTWKKKCCLHEHFSCLLSLSHSHKVTRRRILSYSQIDSPTQKVHTSKTIDFLFRDFQWHLTYSPHHTHLEGNKLITISSHYVINFRSTNHSKLVLAGKLFDHFENVLLIHTWWTV